MRLLRLLILGFLIVTGNSGCLTGAGTSSSGPGASPATPSGFVRDLGGTFVGGSAGSGTTASAGGSDTMPPRPDMGDKMPAVGPTVGDQRISYLLSPTKKIRGGNPDEPAALVCEGKAALDGAFLIELGEADKGCDNDSCWKWSLASEGHFVRIRIIRGTSDKKQEFYQDVHIGPVQSDGSNLTIGGLPIQDGDVLNFAYTASSAEPAGYAPALAEWTGDVNKIAPSSDLGYFKIGTGATTYMKPDAPSAAERFFDSLF